MWDFSAKIWIYSKFLLTLPSNVGFFGKNLILVKIHHGYQTLNEKTNKPVKYFELISIN